MDLCTAEYVPIINCESSGGNTWRVFFITEDLCHGLLFTIVISNGFFLALRPVKSDILVAFVSIGPTKLFLSAETSSGS